MAQYSSAFAPSSNLLQRYYTNAIELRATLEDFRFTTTIPHTQPAALHTFAGKVENGIIQKFGSKDTQRVIDSWRLLDKEYEHREFFGKEGTDPQTSDCYQYAHSYVPGLTVKPFWDIDEIPWTQKLAKSYKEIRKEFLDVTKDMKKYSTICLY
jgi:hypothetical protein